MTQILSWITESLTRIAGTVISILLVAALGYILFTRGFFDGATTPHRTIPETATEDSSGVYQYVPQRPLIDDNNVTSSDSSGQDVREHEVPDEVTDDASVSGTVVIEDTAGQEAARLLVTRPDPRWFPDFSAPSRSAYSIGGQSTITWTPAHQPVFDLHMRPTVGVGAVGLRPGLSAGLTVVRVGPAYLGGSVLLTKPDDVKVRPSLNLGIELRDQLHFSVGVTPGMRPTVGLSYHF